MTYLRVIKFVDCVVALGILTLINFPLNEATEHANAGEFFTYKIEPFIFNWTQGAIEQFRYRCFAHGHPDLPSWMRYMYSNEYIAGFLYGTPPEQLVGQKIILDVVALNKQTYETYSVVVSVYISPKLPLTNIIQMKIDNLNWIHFMDPGRVENLRNIFSKELWTESKNDLILVFMESTVNMGGRLPLMPQQREGVIVSLGSYVKFSSRLKELQEEIRPLYKLTSCTYKRTSVQKLFENAGFKLDWCAFKLIGSNISPEILYHSHKMKNYRGSELYSMKLNHQWTGIERDESPQRNYIDEFAFALAIPGMILAILLGISSAIFFFQHETFMNNALNSKIGKVQMLQCSNTITNHTVTTLKGLKDPTCLVGNPSINSRRSSQNNNLLQFDDSPQIYLRPNPPPYKANAILNKNSVDI